MDLTIKKALREAGEALQRAATRQRGHAVVALKKGLAASILLPPAPPELGRLLPEVQAAVRLCFGAPKQAEFATLWTETILRVKRLADPHTLAFAALKGVAPTLYGSERLPLQTVALHVLGVAALVPGASLKRSKSTVYVTYSDGMQLGLKDNYALTASGAYRLLGLSGVPFNYLQVDAASACKVRAPSRACSVLGDVASAAPALREDAEYLLACIGLQRGELREAQSAALAAFDIRPESEGVSNSEMERLMAFNNLMR